MARHAFGGTGADQVVDGQGNFVPFAAGTAFTAQSGGTTITDLQKPDTTAITVITADATGLPQWLGPDGVDQMWVDFGFGRRLARAVDTETRVAALESLVATLVATALTTASIGVIGGIPGPLDVAGDMPIGQIPGIGSNNGIAATDRNNFLFESELADSVMLLAKMTGGAYPLRFSVTSSQTRTVLWRGTTDPTFADGFALPGLDLWLDDNGVTWVSSADGTWHGQTGGGSGVPQGQANFTTTVTLSVTGTTSSGGGTGVIFGSSPGGTGTNRMTSMITSLAPNLVRSYESGVPALFTNGNQGKYVPSGTPQCNSCKPDIATLSAGAGGAYTTLTGQLKTYFAGLEDIAEQRAAVHHEPEGDTGFTVAQWAQAQINFQTDVIDVINVSRTHPIKAVAILQGYTLQTASGRDISTWFTPAMLAVVDEIGFDIYNAAQIPLAGAYSTTVGVPWSIPEYGYSTSTVGTDAAQKAFLLANTPGMRTMGNPPKMCALFDGAVGLLTTPITTAVSGGDTSIQVANVPGLAGVIDSFTAHSITIGYGTANVETVTMTGTSSQLSAGATLPYTLPVPALAHSHSVGDAVLLMPLTAAYWRSLCLS